MKHHATRRMARLLHAGVLLLISAVGTAALADDSAKGTPPPASGASLLGGALPGGAILSAAFVQVTPATGGITVTVAIAADGSFRAGGLKPGSYQVAFTSKPKQTQGTSFGEKVQAGMQQAGSAIASGATRTQTATAQPAAVSAAAAQPQQTQRQIDSTPARISTNFTVGKQTGRAVVDGPAVLVEVGADGVLAGRTSPSTAE